MVTMPQLFYRLEEHGKGTDVYASGTQTFDWQQNGTPKVMTAAEPSITDGNKGANYNINYVTNARSNYHQTSRNVTAQTDTKLRW
jgi:hypothetical protein